MALRLNYFVIPAIAAATSALGGAITSANMVWYATLTLPAWTPPGSIIGIVWTVIFILTALAAIMVWNTFPRSKRFWWTVVLFVANAALNVGWSAVFFGAHALGWAVLEALALLASVVALIVLIRPISRLAAVLLYPYAFWVAFATYLTFRIFQLN